MARATPVLLGVSAAVLLGLAAAGAGRATTIRSVPLSRAAARASAVVLGTVHGIECRRAATPSGRTRIFTCFEFRDLSVARGTVATSNLVLPVIGGTMDGRTLTVPGTPAFERGRRYLLFLDPAEPFCGIAGWTQGVFRIVRGPDGRDRVFDHDGAPIAAVADGHVVRGEPPMDLASFLAAERVLAETTSPLLPGPRDDRREEPR